MDKPWADLLMPRAKKEHRNFLGLRWETVFEVRALSKVGEGGRGYRHLQSSLVHEFLESMSKQVGDSSWL